MSNGTDTFFTTVGCMDGRVQEPIAKLGRALFHAQYPDTITEAGIVGLLVKKPIDQPLLYGVKLKILGVSLGKHHSKGIIVHGHQECAGNPVSDAKQKQDIREAAELIVSLVPKDTNVVPVFVKRQGKSWVIEQLQ